MTNPRSSSKRQKAPAANAPVKPDARPAALRVLGQLRTPEWATLAATIAISIWAWITFVVATPQDFPGFILVFAIANIVGATLQVIFVIYVRPSGSLRQRLSFGSYGGSLAGSWIVLVAPPVVFGLIILLVTPPDTPVDGFDPGMSLYQVIAITTLLSLVFTVIGAGAVSTLIVLPITLLIAALLPKGRGEVERPDAPGLTRSQLALGALLIASMIGFALSITSVVTTTASTRYERMADQFIAFITGAGNPVASATTWFFIVAIVVICVISNRSEARRRKAAQ